MTNRNAVLLFLHRTSSVLFPPNKYEIKSLFLSFALFKAAFVVISSVHSVHLSVAFNFVLEVNEGWEPAMGRGLAPL